MRQFWLVPRTLLVGVTVVTVAVSKDVVVIVVTGTRKPGDAILWRVKRHEMTLAGQFLLLIQCTSGIVRQPLPKQ